MIGMRMWCSKVRAGERWKTQGKRNKETWEPGYPKQRRRVASVAIFRPKLIHCGDSGTMQWGSIEIASTAEFQKGNSVEFENTCGNSRKVLKLKIAFFAQTVQPLEESWLFFCSHGTMFCFRVRCASWTASKCTDAVHQLARSGATQLPQELGHALKQQMTRSGGPQLASNLIFNLAWVPGVGKLERIWVKHVLIMHRIAKFMWASIYECMNAYNIWTLKASREIVSKTAKWTQFFGCDCRAGMGFGTYWRWSCTTTLEMLDPTFANNCNNRRVPVLTPAFQETKRNWASKTLESDSNHPKKVNLWA